MITPDLGGWYDLSSRPPDPVWFRGVHVVDVPFELWPLVWVRFPGERHNVMVNAELYEFHPIDICKEACERD